MCFTLVSNENKSEYNILVFPCLSLNICSMLFFCSVWLFEIGYQGTKSQVGLMHRAPDKKSRIQSLSSKSYIVDPVSWGLTIGSEFRLRRLELWQLKMCWPYIYSNEMPFSRHCCSVTELFYITYEIFKDKTDHSACIYDMSFQMTLALQWHYVKTKLLGSKITMQI